MLVLRIKKYWLDKILRGEKIIEYRRICDFYSVRLSKNPDRVMLLCGRNKCIYEIKKTEIVQSGDLGDFEQFAIHLGRQISSTVKSLDVLYIPNLS